MERIQTIKEVFDLRLGIDYSWFCSFFRHEDTKNTPYSIFSFFGI